MSDVLTKEELQKLEDGFRNGNLDPRGTAHVLIKTVKAYQQWVNDLQAGMYVNCIYCGHRYGPEDETPVAMADVLKEHIESCTAHPMYILKDKYEWALEENKHLKQENERLEEGNSALAAGCCEHSYSGEHGRPLCKLEHKRDYEALARHIKQIEDNANEQ